MDIDINILRDNLNNKLEWSEIEGATSYNIEVSENNIFDNNIQDMSKNVKVNSLEFSGIENAAAAFP